VARQGKFLLVPVKKFFLSGEGGPNIEDGEVHTCYETVERVNQGTFADLLVLEVSREDFPERNHLFQNLIVDSLLYPSSSRMEMWLEDIRMLSLMAFSSRKRLM
jgi:hypothetical protein